MLTRNIRTGYYKRNLLRKDSGSSLLSRTSATQVITTHEYVILTGDVSERWIIVFETHLCHSRWRYIILIRVLSRNVSVSPS